MQDLLTGTIISSAYKVWKTLGFGFLEKVYENAMNVELSKAGLKVEQQYALKVFYEDVMVGEYQIDLWVNDQIVVELKAVSQLVPAHEVQLVNYLTATKMDIGLLINFGPSGVVVKRKYRIYRPKEI